MILFREVFVSNKIFRAVSIVFICLAVLFCSILLFSLHQNKDIIVSQYAIGTTQSLNFVLISDLHREEFGKANELLVERVRAQSPDVIFIVGDMLESDCSTDEVESYFCTLSNLVEIAPVYCSYGNHDYTALSCGIMDFEEKTMGIRERLEQSGAVFLEREYVDTVINGEALRIGGLYDLAFDASEFGMEDKCGAGFYATDEDLSARFAFLTDFCDTSSYKIMLSHRPDSFIFGDASSRWNIDTVLCGHTHNGVIALPLVGALLIPDQGFFPKYDKGVFDLNGTTMIICGGLAGWHWIPRILNPPEIVSVGFSTHT